LPRNGFQPNSPGTALWTPPLGRGWSHTYAERIVLDPDQTHVWLITRHGTFREFSGLSGGIYATAKPTDEHRKLTHTATGWRLTSLDGTLEDFDASGRWSQTTSNRFQPNVPEASVRTSVLPRCSASRRPGETEQEESGGELRPLDRSFRARYGGLLDSARRFGLEPVSRVSPEIGSQK
jgi:hypothetical protein